MNSEAVFRVIEQAKRSEAKTQAFHHMMEDKIHQLHLIIGLHDEDPADCLVKFAIEYIEMAPQVMECVEACAKEAHAEWLFEPFVNAAFNYFVNPTVIFSHYTGLDGLLMKAYLCHRLLEEMYENNKSIRNSQLCAVEVTQANLLAHQLIGEPFANELDESMLMTVKQVAGSPKYYDLNLNAFVEKAQHPTWKWMRDHWTSLLSRNHIQFHFSYRHVL